METLVKNIFERILRARGGSSGWEDRNERYQSYSPRTRR